MMKNNKIPVGLLIGIVGLVAFVMAIALVKMRVVKPMSSGDTPAQTNLQPSSAPIMELRERPVGTENWEQYVNKEHKIAFLFPPGWRIDEGKVAQQVAKAKEGRWSVSYILGSDPNAAGAISLSKRSLPDLIDEVKKDYEYRQQKIVQMDSEIVNGFVFTVFETNNGGHIGYLYCTQRNEKTVCLGTLGKPEEKILFSTLLLDGSHYTGSLTTSFRRYQ